MSRHTLAWSELSADPKARVLWIAGTPPGCHSVGAIFLRDALSVLPHDRVACVVVGPIVDRESIGCLPWLDKLVLPMLGGPWPKFGTGPKGRLARFAWWLTLFTRQRPALSAQVVRYAKERCVQRIVVQPNDPVLWVVANHTAERLNVPLSVLLLDPPGYLISRRGADRAMRRILVAEFGRLMRLSERTGCASPAMAQFVQDRYGRSANVTFHGFDEQDWVGTRSGPQVDGELRIGFAGGLYATDAWDAFVGALDSVRWQVAGRSVMVVLIGNVGVSRVGYGAHYQLKGWMPQRNVIHDLASMDIAYLPYWFASAYREVCELSFPTKLSTYLAASLPVFFHGPSYSGPGRYIEEHGIGLFCRSLQPAAIIQALHSMLSPDNFATYGVRIRSVRSAMFSAESFRRSIAWVLHSAVEADQTSTGAR